MDLSGTAACCRSGADCTILENKEALAAQVLEPGAIMSFSANIYPNVLGKSCDRMYL
jgi:hypothetical protein